MARCSNQPGFSTISAGLSVELALALGPGPAGIQQLRKAIDIFPTSKAVNTLVSFYIRQGRYLFYSHPCLMNNLYFYTIILFKRYNNTHSDNFIFTGDYVAALHILNEFVEFVEACVVAGARGNYNAILHRYYFIMKI